MIAGNCPQCGAPIYASITYNNVPPPPPPTFTCNCRKQGRHNRTCEGEIVGLKEGAFSKGGINNRPSTPRPSVEPMPQSPQGDGREVFEKGLDLKSIIARYKKG